MAAPGAQLRDRRPRRQAPSAEPSAGPSETAPLGPPAPGAGKASWRLDKLIKLRVAALRLRGLGGHKTWVQDLRAAGRRLHIDPEPAVAHLRNHGANITGAENSGAPLPAPPPRDAPPPGWHPIGAFDDPAFALPVRAAAPA